MAFCGPKRAFQLGCVAGALGRRVGGKLLLYIFCLCERHGPAATMLSISS